MARPPRLALAHLPTPLVRYDALDALIGTRVWVKRDDASGGPEAGSKIRKLEFLLAQAQAEGARAVITCGGAQSNHARATAVAARRLGMRPILLLRAETPPSKPWQGNLFLNGLLGSEVRFITPGEYAERDRLMSELARERDEHGEHAYVVPEGGSNGLGALAYVEAMDEIRRQLDSDRRHYPARFDAVVHACGSGGTAAGCWLGAGLSRVADEVIAMAVCDDRAFFTRRIEAIAREASAWLEAHELRAKLRVLDEYKGPAYGVPSREQLQFIEEVARATGLLLDPVYTGKALFGLAQLERKPDCALFLHTGGLPGLLAETALF